MRVSDSIKDLGFKFNVSLDPADYIDFVCFIMRLALEFHLGISVKLLFRALVRPILAHGAVV